MTGPWRKEAQAGDWRGGDGKRCAHGFGLVMRLIKNAEIPHRLWVMVENVNTGGELPQREGEQEGLWHPVPLLLVCTRGLQPHLAFGHPPAPPGWGQPGGLRCCEHSLFPKRFRVPRRAWEEGGAARRPQPRFPRAEPGPRNAGTGLAQNQTLPRAAACSCCTPRLAPRSSRGCGANPPVRHTAQLGTGWSAWRQGLALRL